MEQRSCEDKLQWILLGGVAGFAVGTLVTSAKNKRSAPCLLPKDDPITISGRCLTLTSAVPWSSWSQTPDDWGHPEGTKRITEVDIDMQGYRGTIKPKGGCEVEVTYAHTTVVFHSTGPQGDKMHFLVRPGPIAQVFAPADPKTLQHSDSSQHIQSVKVRTPGSNWEGSPPEGIATITIHYQP